VYDLRWAFPSICSKDEEVILGSAGPKENGRKGLRLHERGKAVIVTEGLTAWENLAYYADPYHVPRPRVSVRVEELLEEFGLTDRADEPVGRYGCSQEAFLSGGDR